MLVIERGKQIEHEHDYETRKLNRLLPAPLSTD
jgi:hypothetical protein